MKTIRLLSTYKNNPPKTIITLDDAIANALLAGGVNATLDLTGGVRTAPPVLAPPRANALVSSSAGGLAVSLDVGQRARRFPMGSIKGACKWFGAAIAGVTFAGPVANGSAYRATYGLTGVAEAPFYAMQLVYVNLCNNPITGLRAIVGVTESIASDVAANRCKPVIGGVAYGTLAPAGSVLGFRPTTWGGAATMTCAAPATSQQIAVTDIVPISSIPRVDVPGALPAWIMRLDHDPATGGRFSFCTMPVGMRTANAANRGRVVQSFNYGADAVTNPNINIGLSGDSHLVFPIFHYAVPSLTVVVAGDSIEQNDALVADVFTSWGFRGCADASTPARPVNYVNMGASSKGAPEYWLRTQELVAAGIVPDVLVISPPSVNDGYLQANLARNFSDHKARTLEIVRFARAHGINNVAFIPLFPYNSNTVAQEEYRVEFNSWLTTIPGVTTLSFPGLGDGAVPERWAPAYNHLGDGIHPNELAIETILAPVLTAYLNSIA
ncbi:SGNH/GDSL hydrolase family protein [Massilia scottii]|uniref:SGNH/GDSL hydrolase family protein n=1 Tax=Massilia scottii TaxID=3057166 RepID=UPI0027969094|nr:SGNH/GDSL hydrolase family protein [Massilia sp. CCM 9029]MDQ1834657.1 SGNH/GDSL hydrolase family protein [Massilia sp. CCM 9029]